MMDKFQIVFVLREGRKILKKKLVKTIVNNIYCNYLPYLKIKWIYINVFHHIRAYVILFIVFSRAYFFLLAISSNCYVQHTFLLCIHSVSIVNSFSSFLTFGNDEFTAQKYLLNLFCFCFFFFFTQIHILMCDKPTLYWE